jgi:hypothetical protein
MVHPTMLYTDFKAEVSAVKIPSNSRRVNVVCFTSVRKVRPPCADFHETRDTLRCIMCEALISNFIPLDKKCGKYG